MTSTAHADLRTKGWSRLAAYGALFFLPMALSAYVTTSFKASVPRDEGASTHPPIARSPQPDARAEVLLAAVLTEPRGVKRPVSARDPQATALLKTAAATRALSAMRTP